MVGPMGTVEHGGQGLGPLFPVTCIWPQGPQLGPLLLASVVMCQMSGEGVGVSQSVMEAISIFASLFLPLSLSPAMADTSTQESF